MPGATADTQHRPAKPPPGDAPTQSSRLARAFQAEFLAGLRIATLGRSLALIAIALLVLVQNIGGSWETLVYFEAIIAVFGLLGIAHYRLANSRYHHDLHKYLFVLADVCLLTFIINSMDCHDMAANLN